MHFSSHRTDVVNSNGTPRGNTTSYYSSLKTGEDLLIMNRPDDIDTREKAGHWEGDLFVGAMNKSVLDISRAQKQAT